MGLTKNKNKVISKILALTLCVALVAGTLALGAGATSAYAADSEKTGTVTTASLYVRSGPGTSYSSTGYLIGGDEVTILSEAYDSSGSKWYYISYSGIGGSGTGYSSATYIDVNNESTYEYDASFENELSSEGFPESYKEALRKLHAQYPEWKFKAAQTGLSWDDVIAKESKLGTSLVASSSVSAWKSKASGAYDAETGKYTTYDSGGWVAASEGIIKYYMDPRNFLNKNGIFQFMTHSYDSQTQNISGLNRMLSGTFMAGELADEPGTTYAEVLMEAGASAGVNPYVLASMIIVEQGSNGIGGSVSGTVSGYEGYYNYFNIGAYKSGGMDAVTRGLWYASQEGSYERPWDTIRKSITGGAEFYAANYVNNNKNTLYFKKWNVMNGLDSVGVGQYMTNIQGAESEATQLRNAYSSVMDSSMTFLIPVYESMPSSACKKPTTDEQTTEPVTVEKKAQVVTTRYTSYTRKETDSGKSFNLSAETSGDGALTYVSSDTSVATVDENGQVSIVGGIGVAEITVTAAETDKYAKGQKVCKLTVKALSDEEKQAIIDKYTAGLAKTEIINVKATATTKKVKLTWEKSSSGYAVDAYQIWRSAKKSSGYKKFFTTSDATKCTYTNNKDITKNTTYWYKVRGVRTIQGKLLYTPFTKIQVKTPA